MFAKVLNDTVVKFPYTKEDLQNENPYTNFGNALNLQSAYVGTEDSMSTGCTIASVIVADIPQYDEVTQKIVQKSIPEKVEDIWVLGWDVVSLNEQESLEMTQRKMLQVRQERTRMLSESDWTQVLDSPVDRTAWAQYRQQLRDITLQPEFPHSVNWPEKPQ